jgi:iron complex outermembrane receptor protein
MPLTPRSKWTLSGTYRLPLDPDLGPVSVGAEFVWTGRELNNSHEPFAYLPGYGLLNLNVNWEKVAGRPIDIEFFMTNVLDRYYPTYLTDFATVAGVVSATIGQPRMFGGRLRYHF